MKAFLKNLYTKQLVALLILSLTFSFQLKAQNQALYYFSNDLNEITGKYPPLIIDNESGSFVDEVVEKFGKEKRKVYVFPLSSGLVFNNSQLKNFISGSYGIEMYFRYDDGSLLLYNQLLGNQLNDKQGKYVHLVTTRDKTSQKVNVFIDGKLSLSFKDSDNNLDMNASSQITFFSEEGKPTTSGAVAMIKIYDFFVDETMAIDLFTIFNTDSSQKVDIKSGVLNNLYFIQSTAIILPESYPELESLFSFLGNNPKIKIKIQGHTDNQGDFNLNSNLSKERAVAVKNYLVNKGIQKTRIITQGFGSLKPIASNNDESTRRKNRRVEIIIL